MYQKIFSVLALSLMASACRSDPPLERVFGEFWEEAPTSQNGRDEWRTLSLGAGELILTQHCGELAAQVRVPIQHEYVYTVLEAVDKTTRAEGYSCRYTVEEGVGTATLALDGQNLIFGDGTVATPDGEVNGIFGPRVHPDDDGDGVFEWWVTPTYIDSRAICSSGLKVSAEIPIDLEHYLFAAEGASASDGDCSVRFGSGRFRYYPEGDELTLETDDGDIEFARAF